MLGLWLGCLMAWLQLVSCLAPPCVVNRGDQECGSLRQASRRELGAELGSRETGMGNQAAITVPLESHQDYLWTTQVQVGTHPFNYTLAIDTGSADMWIDASAFNASASQTFAEANQNFSIHYDLGQVSGYVGTDHVQIQGLSVEKQVFGIATNISDTNIPKGVQGVMGMAGHGLSHLHTKPFWQNLHLNQSLFSIYLKGAIHDNHTIPSDGILSLGTMDPNMFNGPLNNLPTLSPDSWTINFSGINVSNHIIKMGANTKALIDSGTILIGGPRDAIEEFYRQFKGATEIKNEPGFFSFPCSSTPDVYLAFGNAQYKLKPADLILNEAQYAPDDQDGRPDSDDFKCVGSVFATDPGDPWMIGGSFLKNVYTVFNNEVPRQIGFAPLNARSYESEILPVGLPSSSTSLSPAHWIFVCLITVAQLLRS